MIALPQGDTPGDKLAELFEVLAVNLEAGPLAEMAFLVDGQFEGGVVEGVAEDAAQFGAQFQLAPIHAAGLPLHGQAQAGALGGMLAQPGLVGVALKEAGGKGGLAVLIEKLGQGLDDFGDGDWRGRGPRGQGRQAEKGKAQAQASHGGKVAGGQARHQV